MATKTKVTEPIGVTGLSVWRGTIMEEYLTQLKGPTGRKVFREMADDAVIGVLIDAILMPLLSAEVFVVPASDKEGDTEAADFVQSVMGDMTRYSWRQHIVDLLWMMVYGWSVSEIILKKRLGYEKEPPSKFNDGKLGIHLLDPRGQETLDSWMMADDGTVEGMKQRDPNTGKILEIPAWKMVHVAFRMRKRNPEGRSPMAQLYRPWYMRKNLEVLEAIGAERDLAGIPMIKLPYGAGSAEANAAETIVRNLRNDEQAGIVLPPPNSPEKDAQRWELQLLSGGAKAYNTRETIRDYNKLILMRFFAQFLFLGMEQAGTQALVKGSHDFFSLGLKSVQAELIEAWNDQLIPLLMAYNNFPGITGYPRYDWAEPGKADLAGLSTLLKELVSVNVITPGVDIEDFVRSTAGLPDRPEGVGEEPRNLPQKPSFFAQKATEQPRNRLERETTAYQDELLSIYDTWSQDTTTEMLKVERWATKPDDVLAVMDRRLPSLAGELKKAAEKAIRKAIYLGLRTDKRDAEAEVLIAERVKRNGEFVDTSLIPDLKKKMTDHVMESWGKLRQYQLDGITLLGSWATFRARVGSYAGVFWEAIFAGAHLDGHREDEALIAEGKKPHRVRWVLDPTAQHCEDSEGFYGCVDLAGEYDSWDDLPTVPAGFTTCRGNCSCQIMREVDGVWESIAW